MSSHIYISTKNVVALGHMRMDQNMSNPWTMRERQNSSDLYIYILYIYMD